VCVLQDRGSDVSGFAQKMMAKMGWEKQVLPQFPHFQMACLMLSVCAGAWVWEKPTLELQLMLW